MSKPQRELKTCGAHRALLTREQVYELTSIQMDKVLVIEQTTRSLVYLSTSHRGVSRYPPTGEDRGEGLLLLSHFTPLSTRRGAGGEAFLLPPLHIKPSTNTHTILHIAVSSTDIREACLGKRVV